MSCPLCRKTMQYNNGYVEVDSEDFQDYRTIEVNVYYCFDCEVAKVEEKGGGE